MYEEEFPYYLSIGMTYEQYWYGDPLLIRDYRKAERLRQEAVNHNAWLQGAYVYNALLCVAPVLQAFRKKNTKPADYPKEPYKAKAESENRQPGEQEIKNERLRAQLYFTQWARATARHFNR